MGWEEEILFPSIARRNGIHMPNPSARVRSQHRKIRELLDEISGCSIEK